jgi:hypothetical protein
MNSPDVESSKNGRRLHTLQIFDRMTMTFGCTDLNETHIIFYFAHHFTHFFYLDDKFITRQDCRKNNVNYLRIW